MASRICDAEGRRTSKITVHTVPRPYLESSPADFASKYTTKSGTPLLHREDGTPCSETNMLAVCTPSPLVYRDVMPSDSSFGDVTRFSEDPSQSVFCVPYNVQSCLQYLDQEMSSLGLQSVFCGTSENVDSVKFINNVYHLIKRHSSVRELADRRQQLEKNIETLSHTNERLQRDLEDSEQTRARLELAVTQLRASNKDLAGKLKVEKDEVRRLELVSQHREVQYRHESRKKEQELEKMKDRMHKLITEKTSRRAAGMVLSQCVAKTSYGDDTDVFRRVLGSYEDRQKMLLSDNGDLRNALLELQKELIAMLHSDDNKHTTDKTQTHADMTETRSQEEAGLQADNTRRGSSSANVAEGYFEMPYNVSGDDMLTTLKQKFALLKQHLHNLESSQTSSKNNSSRSVPDESSDDQPTLLTAYQQQNELLKMKLDEYKRVIFEQQELMLQTLEAPADCCDVSFLVETCDFEEKENLAAKQRYIRRQQEQLQQERDKLLDFATKLAKQRDEVENMRLELLHEEFMMLTPFRACKTTSRLDGNSVTATPSTSSRFKSSVPTTADLFRQLGIVAASTRRSHTNGRYSLGNFLLRTRSAISQGLHNSSPSEKRVQTKELPATALHEEDEMLKLDDVKTCLFTLEKE